MNVFNKCPTESRTQNVNPCEVALRLIEQNRFI